MTGNSPLGHCAYILENLLQSVNKVFIIVYKHSLITETGGIYVQLKLIEAFVTIVECGSFTAAAERLFISQPALSQQIRKLEDTLGVKLFDQRRHASELTPSGELFLQEGKRILQIYNQLLQRLDILENPTLDIIRFGISPFYSRHYLPHLLPPLISKHPSLKYEITENYSYLIEKELIDGHLDFCMVPQQPKNPLLEYEPLHLETIWLAIPRDHPANHYANMVDGVPCMDLRRMKDEPFIALKSVQKFSQYSQKLCEDAGFTPNVVCETMNWDALNRLVATGLGIGFVPDLVINQLDKSIRPHYYQLLPNAQRLYTIAYRQGDHLSPATRIMIDVFRAAFAQISFCPPEF